MSGPLTDAAIARHAYQAGFRGNALVTAVAVALAESGGRARARGDETLQNGTWGPSVGLWQIRSLHQDRGTGRTRDEVANLDPATNARHAWQISGHGRNWQPWSAYTNGSYRPFLDRARTAARHARSAPGSGGAGTAPHSGHRRGTPRIVLDLAELHRLETLLESSRHRVEHSQRVLREVAADLRLAETRRPDPAYARHLALFFGELDGPYGLPMVARHLDFTLRLVQRTRHLARVADGPDGRYGAADLVPFLQRVGKRIDLPEAAILEALVAGGFRTGHGPGGPGHRNGPAPRVPSPPPRQRMAATVTVPPALRRHGNGRLPAGVLVGIGDGEKLSRTAGDAFRRMDAAARSDRSTNLVAVSGYRDRAEQARLYQLYLSGRGNLAAAPGTSNHGWGLSVDIDVRSDPDTLRWLRANAARYGFFNDVASEPWHWTYRPA